MMAAAFCPGRGPGSGKPPMAIAAAAAFPGLAQGSGKLPMAAAAVGV